MSLGKNIQNPTFWVNVLKIGLPFFIFFSFFALVFYTWSDFFSGNWKAVYEYHFANKRWVRFLLQKGVVSVLYAMYVANKNMK